MNHYILTVRAQDSGTDSKSSTVLVYMNVLDINDNAPVFDPSSYSNEVWENATVGTSILMVSATDIDDGMIPNSVISYISQISLVSLSEKIYASLSCPYGKHHYGSRALHSSISSYFLFSRNAHGLGIHVALCPSKTPN